MFERLAVYLDEVADDPYSACAILSGLHITNVCLRTVWNKNVCNLGDQALGKLKEILNQFNMTVVLVASDLNRQDGEDLRRPLLVANYYGAGMVRFWGYPRKEQAKEWLGQLETLALAASITPLLEPHRSQWPWEAVDYATALSGVDHWQLLYDPAQLLLGGRSDQFERYWTLLKSKVAAIDLHDLATGLIMRPPGLGDCLLQRILKDALQSGYRGWYLLEPGLGRRYGSVAGKQATFGLAWEAWNRLKEEVAKDLGQPS